MDLSVSFIIPVYNGTRFIGETLEYVFAQTVAPHEVIVVDDGSTDDLDRTLAAWRNRIELIRIPNSGVNVARNMGAARATGTWLAFMDSDDIPLPSFVESQFRLIEASGNARSSIVDFADVRGIEWAEESHFSYAPNDFWNVGRRDFGDMGFVADESVAERMPIFQPTIPSSCMISRDLFQEMNGWDLRMNREPGGQDTEFHFRQSDHPPIAVVPHVRVGYRKHSGAWTADDVGAQAASLALWKKIAVEFELGLKHAAVIEKAVETGAIDMLTAAFNRRRFDVCRRWKYLVPANRRPLPLAARMALAELPDPVIRTIAAAASTIRRRQIQPASAR